MRYINCFALTVVFMFTVASALSAGESALRLDPASETLLPSPCPEPSGIVYHPLRKTLFVVGDEGDIAEMDAEGTVLQRVHLGKVALPHRKADKPAHEVKADLEGITCDPASGRLYVAVEGADAILEIDAETLGVLRACPVARDYEGRTVIAKGHQGFEAIAFVSGDGGSLWVANQCVDPALKDDASALLRIALPPNGAQGEARIIAYHPIDTLDLSALVYDAKRNVLLAVSDNSNEVLTVSLDGQVVSSEPLPGRDQEGLALDDAGHVFIAQDSGGVLRFARHPAKD